MTLDEAIKQCEEVAEGQEWLATKDIGEYSTKLCLECASEHRQLVEWLKALKEIWDSGDCNNCRRYKCDYKPKLGQLVRYNCPHYVGISNGEVKADDSIDRD